MDLKKQKQLAARTLNVGINRIWIDPNRVEEVQGAITRADIRNLIDSGAIKKKGKTGSSQGRARAKKRQKEKGRKKGHGRRKGSKKARGESKWKDNIRALRKKLKSLKENGKISQSSYKDAYNKAGGGFFRNVKHLMIYLDKQGALEDKEVEV